MKELFVVAVFALIFGATGGIVGYKNFHGQAQSTEDYELIAERVHLKSGTIVRVDDLERNAICYLSTVGMSCVQDWNSQ